MDHQFAMQCYCRVVETGSFAAAARDFNCSPSAVTKQIQQLEGWTRCRLLTRTTRSMHVTDAGDRFYRHCKQVLAETDAVLEAIRASGQTAEGRLVVSAPVSLTLGFLAPQLRAFQEAHPAIELELRLNDRAVDLVREGVDVALRGRAGLEDSSLVAVPLMQIDRVLCAAPRYWQHAGTPTEPAQLQHHNALAYLLGTDALRWRFERDDRVEEVPVTGNLRSDNSLLLVDSMLAGRGVGLVPRVLVEHHLREGRLVAALDDWRIAPRHLYAVYAGRAHQPLRVAALVQFLKQRLQP